MDIDEMMVNMMTSALMKDLAEEGVATYDQLLKHKESFEKYVNAIKELIESSTGHLIDVDGSTDDGIAMALTYDRKYEKIAVLVMDKELAKSKGQIGLGDDIEESSVGRDEVIGILLFDNPENMRNFGNSFVEFADRVEEDGEEIIERCS